jgi:hypothetical protein
MADGIDGFKFFSVFTLYVTASFPLSFFLCERSEFALTFSQPGVSGPLRRLSSAKLYSPLPSSDLYSPLPTSSFPPLVPLQLSSSFATPFSFALGVKCCGRGRKEARRVKAARARASGAFLRDRKAQSNMEV